MLPSPRLASLRAVSPTGGATAASSRSTGLGLAASSLIRDSNHTQRHRWLAKVPRQVSPQKFLQEGGHAGGEEEEQQEQQQQQGAAAAAAGEGGEEEEQEQQEEEQEEEQEQEEKEE